MLQNNMVQVNKAQTDQLTLQSGLAKSASVKDKKTDKTMSSLSNHMSFMAVTLTSIDKNITDNTKMMTNVGKFLTSEKMSKKPVNLAEEAKKFQNAKKQSSDIADIAKLMEENNKLTKNQKTGTKHWLTSLVSGLAKAGLIAGGVGLLAWLFTGDGGALKKLTSGAKSIGGFFGWLVGGDDNSFKNMFEGIKGLGSGIWNFLITGETDHLKVMANVFKQTLPQEGILGWFVTGKAGNFAKDVGNFAKDTGGIIKGVLTGDFSGLIQGLSAASSSMSSAMAGGGLLMFMMTGNPFYLAALYPAAQKFWNKVIDGPEGEKKAERSRVSVVGGALQQMVSSNKMTKKEAAETKKEFKSLSKALTLIQGREIAGGYSAITDFLDKNPEKRKSLWEKGLINSPKDQPDWDSKFPMQKWSSRPTAILPEHKAAVLKELFPMITDAMNDINKKVLLKPTDYKNPSIATGAQDRFLKMKNLYEKETGESIDIGTLGGLRTREQQEILYQGWKKKQAGEKGMFGGRMIQSYNPADMPGKSVHEFGLGYDVGKDMAKKLSTMIVPGTDKTYMEAFGFYQLDNPLEKHHIEGIETRGDRTAVRAQLSQGKYAGRNNMPSTNIDSTVVAESETKLDNHTIAAVGVSVGKSVVAELGGYGSSSQGSGGSFFDGTPGRG